MTKLYKHIFLDSFVSSERYKAQSKPVNGLPIPKRNRASHSAKLLEEFERIWREKREISALRGAEQIPTREGTYVEFTSMADHDLITKSLENMKAGIRLLNIKEIIDDDGHKYIKATVYIPKGKEAYFIRKITQYQDSTDEKKPKNGNLVNSIEDVSIALVESFWASRIEFMPEDQPKWCEVWLNVDTINNKQYEQIASFKSLLAQLDIEYKQEFIVFPERAILLINVSKAQLVEIMLASDMLAEFRIGQELAGFWYDENPIEQQRWVEDLLSRINIIDSSVKICILDTGVNNGHELLSRLIDDNNTLTINSAWGTNDTGDNEGHGTIMAGVAAYGELEKVLRTNNVIDITHKLCSVKILPPKSFDPTQVDLWGEYTSQGISRAEIVNPDKMIIYCMAVSSAFDAEKGRPSSWSGKIDNLCFDDSKRLIIISAGNITDREQWLKYPDANYKTTIDNPGQSWNALIVGAYTEKTVVNDPIFKDYKPIAKAGELSPFSKTSFVWDKRWPIKPDVVFEGGNAMKNEDTADTHQDLQLLTTRKSFTISPFDTISATSAATAQASWMAAKIAYEYPNAWPETIRGLMIHSAEWHPSMLRQLQVGTAKADYKKLLKVFGYGIPNLDKAQYSRESSLTFIAQQNIQPYILNGSNAETNEIHFYDLPWPKDLLLEMGNIPVKLKITLSYFIEPGAGEIGWKDKYRYQSHGLRFDVNNVDDENLDQFRKRINIAAKEEDDEITGSSGSSRWKIGKNNRSNGSVHSDFWEGTAADLATCNLIAVYPVIGWWRERKHLKKVETKTRYSLIISLETPAENIELYTTVANMIKVPIEVKVAEQKVTQ